MANNDLKKIKEILEIVHNKVDKLETHVSLHSSTIYLIKDQQSVMNGKLDNLKEDMDDLKKEVKDMSENVDAARGDIENLHMDVRGIREKEGLMHSRNKREIDEIKTHIGLPLISDHP